MRTSTVVERLLYTVNVIFAAFYGYCWEHTSDLLWEQVSRGLGRKQLSSSMSNVSNFVQYQDYSSSDTPLSLCRLVLVEDQSTNFDALSRLLIDRVGIHKRRMRHSPCATIQL